MRKISTENIEYSEVNFNELHDDMRMDSQYYEPFYLRNAAKIASKPHKPVKDFMLLPQYGISIAMNEYGVGYKMLKMDDIVGILANDENAKYADISQKLFNQFRLNKYDVLFNRVNSDEFVGRTGIYMLNGEHTFASYLVRITSEHTYQNCYLTIFLNCTYGLFALQRVKRRAVNQANINAQELKELVVPYPSVDFQKAIERLIIEAYIMKNNSVIKYDDAEKMLLQALGLSGWSPSQSNFQIGYEKFATEDTINLVSFNDIIKISRIDAEYFSLKFQFINAHLDSLASNKKILLVPLSTLVNVKKGIEVGSLKYVNEPDIPYLRVSNFNKYGVDFTSCKFISLDTYNELKHQYKPKVGEILFSKDGTAGMAYQLRQEFDTINSGGVLRLQNKSEYQTSYIEMLLNSIICQLQVEQLTSGALIQHLKVSEALQLLIPIVPNHKEVVRIVDDSFYVRKTSERFLEIAKKAVEIYIEQDEKAGLRYIEENT